MEPVSRAPAVAVMAKVPGAASVKSRLHPALTAERATELYRCFLLDRLDALSSVAEVAPVVAFTPADAGEAIARIAPPAFRCVPQRGVNLGERLATLLAELIGEGHRGAIAIDSDSPTLPMKYVAEDGKQRWQGHLTALAPASAAQDLDGEFALRFPDGTSHNAFVEQQQTTSQLSPGLDVAVVGTGDPPF